MIKEILKKLNLPQDEILFLHIKLKGLSEEISYKELSITILETLKELYNPKTILIPTFTYSFTKTGVFDRKNSPSEVGRFSEEMRNLYNYKNRTLNPVFNVIDSNNYLSKYKFEDQSAFGKDSMFYQLHKTGHIIVNINIEGLIGTYLHFLESLFNVPYRYNKNFTGYLKIDDQKEKNVDYKYNVRDLDTDTVWKREKIIDVLRKDGGRKSFISNGISCSWSDSRRLDKILEPHLRKNKYFLITE